MYKIDLSSHSASVAARDDFGLIERLRLTKEWDAVFDKSVSIGKELKGLDCGNADRNDCGHRREETPSEAVPADLRGKISKFELENDPVVPDGRPLRAGINYLSRYGETMSVMGVPLEVKSQTFDSRKLSVLGHQVQTQRVIQPNTPLINGGDESIACFRDGTDVSVVVGSRNTRLMGADASMLLQEVKTIANALSLRLKSLKLNGQMVYHLATPPQGVSVMNLDAVEGYIDQRY